jgi:hypothetical protein
MASAMFNWRLMMKIFMFVPWNPLDGYILETPNDSVQLVPITPMSLWFVVPITIVFMVLINHLITGGPHIV